MDLPNPVIRSRYGNGFIKQYVRDHLAGPYEVAPLDLTPDVWHLHTARGFLPLLLGSDFTRSRPSRAPS